MGAAILGLLVGLCRDAASHSYFGRLYGGHPSATDHFTYTAGRSAISILPTTL